MITQFFRRFVINRFLNKILLVYAAIIVLALSSLAVFVTINLSSILTEREIKYNKLILYNINRYVDNKIDLVKKISEQAYIENLAFPEVFNFLENSNDDFGADYIEKKQRFSDYFRSTFSRDRDIKSIIIYKKADHSYYIYSRNFEGIYQDKDFKYKDRLLSIGYWSTTLTIFPTFSPQYLKEKDTKVYTMTLNIKARWSTENLGMLIVDYDANGIDNILSQYDKDLKGNILILTRNREVVYDSSNTYYGKKYPYLGTLLTATNNKAKIDGNEYIINLDRDNDSGLIIAGVVPKKQILGSINSTNQLIYILLFVCIFVSILLAFISTGFFSKRIKVLTDAMKKIREGNLAIRIPITKNLDEISIISLNFNRMCEDLDLTIQKTLELGIGHKNAEIRQKNAEMTALQAQINPHFLYNTLEAIRMKAVSGGDTDVSDMIFSLSRLFRNSIKEDSYITIKDEITNCKLYLNLYQIRYNDKLSVEFDIPNDILPLGIIKHTIQPIIENYFIHGFHPIRSDNVIRIIGYQEGNDLNFRIEDNGKGMEPDKLQEIQDTLHSGSSSSSIGLANVNERIKLVFDRAYGITVESEFGKGTTVIIRMAAKTTKDLMERV